MADLSIKTKAPTVEELDEMHALYRQGGQERQMAPSHRVSRGRLSLSRLRSGDAGD